MTEADIKNLCIWPRHLYSLPYLSRVGLCAAGCRAFWTAQGWSWADFVAHGIPASKLMDTRHPVAVQVVEHAWAQQKQEPQDGQG